MKQLFSYWALAYRRYFDFRGYSTREEFWSYVFVHVLLAAVFGLVISGLSMASMASVPAIALIEDESSSLWGVWGVMGLYVMIGLFGLWALFALVSLIPGLAITVRRFRDAGFSGRTFLLMILTGFFLLIPAFVLVYDMVFLFNFENPNTTPGLMGLMGFQILQLVMLTILALPSKVRYG